MRARLLLGEAAADLRSGRWRSALLVGALSACLLLIFGVESRVATTRATLEDAVNRPTARLVRITAFNSPLTIAPERVAALASLDVATGVVGFSEPLDARVARAGATGGGLLRYYDGVLPDTGGAAPMCETGVLGPGGIAGYRLLDSVGELTTDAGHVSIGGVWSPPPELAYLSSSALVRDCDHSRPLKEIAIIVSRPEQLAPATQAGLALFEPAELPELEVRSDEQAIAEQRKLLTVVADDSRRLQFGVALALAGLSTLLLGSFVVQRRSDFGRRRAIGATGAWVAALVVAEALIAALSASVIGTVAALLAGLVWGVAFSPVFAAGAVLMTVGASGLGGLLPAILAARADPIREIRVP